MILANMTNHHPPSYNGQCWETRKLPSPFKRVIRVQLSVEGQILNWDVAQRQSRGLLSLRSRYRNSPSQQIILMPKYFDSAVRSSILGD